MDRIYMDHAATTPVAAEVLDAIMPFFSGKFGNASSLHSFGLEAREAVEDARSKVADLINADPSEVYFTSGGTESDNMAICGIAMAARKKGRHIITSSFEHPAVLEVCRSLESHGFEVTYLPITRDGMVDIDALELAVRKDTVLISIMHANNEIGTVQPIDEIAKMAAEKDIAFHSDCVQTAGKIPLDVRSSGLDAISISAHKIYGPKGAGALYISKEVKIKSIMHGGGHERGLRPGTENVPGIVGLGAAAKLAANTMHQESSRLTALRDRLKDHVLLNTEDSWLNGHPTRRLPSNLNFSFRYIEGESLVLLLDARGIAASTGSACSSRKLTASHVLTALGLKPEECHGSLRLTLGRSNTSEDVEYTGQVAVECVERLRMMSPLGHKKKDISFILL